MNLPLPPDGKPSILPPSPFSLGGSAGSLLKKKEAAIPFKSIQVFNIDLILSAWTLSFDERMRNLDAIRVYKPLPNECSELNIPDERLNLLVLKYILLICGGCCGVRFTSEDFQFIQSQLNILNATYPLIEAEYQRQATKVKKYKLKQTFTINTDTYKQLITDESTTITTLTTINLIDYLSIDVLAFTSSPSTESAADVDAILSESYRQIIALHVHTDYYAYRLSQLHSFILTKQRQIPPSGERIVIEKDPEASVGKRYPDWLSAMIDKYKAVYCLYQLTINSSAGDGANADNSGRLSPLVYYDACDRF